MSRSTIRLNELRPLGLKTAAEVAKLVGSHPGLETLAVREDATVDDLCFVMSTTLRRAWGLATLMATDGNADMATSAGADALAALIEVARKHLEVIRDGIGRAVVLDAQEVGHG